MNRSVISESYFASHEALASRFDIVGRRLGLSARTQGEFESWSAELRGVLRQLIGLDRMVPAPLDPRITETVDCGDYLRERVEIQTEPGVIMPCYVLIPKAKSSPVPAVIAAHGHGSGGKLAVAGRRDIDVVKESIETYHYDYGVQLTRKGFVVFCPDARGFGERQEWMHQGKRESFLHGSCRELNNIAIPLGLSVTGMWVWDLMRLIDYIEQRSECDPTRIGCVGLSGGGLQSLWLGGQDLRVTCTVVSGYFYGYRNALLDKNTHCSCNYVPGLWTLADMGDLGALIAPRPLLIETGLDDPLNGSHGMANVTAQVNVTRQAYDLLDSGDKLTHSTFAGGHRWDGAEAIPWIEKRLQFLT